MDLNFIKGKITREFNGNFNVMLEVSKDQQNSIEALNELLNNDKIKEANIRNRKKKRSLDANAYAWKLMSEIADALKTSKDEVYEEMLKRYGTNETDENGNMITFSIQSKIDISKTQLHCACIGKGTIGEKEFNHYRLIKGSSEYDTKEMSILIDGIVNECKELKISTITPAELEMMKGAWVSGR